MRCPDCAGFGDEYEGRTCLSCQGWGKIGTRDRQSVSAILPTQPRTLVGFMEVSYPSGITITTPIYAGEAIPETTDTVLFYPVTEPAL